METSADRYRRRAAAFADTIAAVPAERWAAPAPCEDWTAREVLAHVVETQGLFLGFIGQTPEPGPDVSEDPLGAFRVAAGQTQRALDDPELAATRYQGFFAESSFAEGVDQFLATDLVVHRWDLAIAVGLPFAIDPVDVEGVWASARAFPEEAMRSPGAFGPAVEPPADADEWEKLLAYLGRDPRLGLTPR